MSKTLVIIVMLCIVFTVTGCDGHEEATEQNAILNQENHSDQIEESDEENVEDEEEKLVLDLSGEGVVSIPINTDIICPLPKTISGQGCIRVNVEKNSNGYSFMTLRLDDSSSEAEECYRIKSVYFMLLSDGRSFVLLDADYMSDDYVTFLYEVTDGSIILKNYVDDAYIQSETVQAGRVGLTVCLNVFGTYHSQMEYSIDEKGELKALAEIFTISQENDSRPAMTVIKELPVTIDDKETMLPIGSKIRIIGTDNLGIAYFRQEDSDVEGSISYIRGDGLEDSWGLYIDGISENEYFDELFYAG